MSKSASEIQKILFSAEETFTVMSSPLGLSEFSFLDSLGSMKTEKECLQEKYAPQNACFGCGPANAKGLHVRSFPKGEIVVAEWKAEPHHEAFPGVLNGGIIGALLDCHSNWTA